MYFHKTILSILLLQCKNTDYAIHIFSITDLIYNTLITFSYFKDTIVLFP